MKMFLNFSRLQTLYKIFGDERIHNMYVVQQLAFERPSPFPLLWHLKMHLHFANT